MQNQLQICHLFFFQQIIYAFTLIKDIHGIFISLISIFLIILISTILYIKKPIEKKSFIGDINIKNKKLKTSLELFLLYFITLFFGFTIFNFFIEWFALSIDSVILVVGLIYYLFQFIRNHTNSNSSQLLWKISNSGNNFYKELIELFSKRSTFFIGVSFLLVIHLMVDTGTYMVPYGIGTQNTLYFDSLNVDDREHTPLFNIFDADNSQFGKDINHLESSKLDTSSKIFLILSILTIHLFYFIGYFLLLLMPFLIYYYNVKQKQIKFPAFLLQIFFISVAFIIIFQLFNSSEFNQPISMGISQNNYIQGLDFYTSQVIEKKDSNIALGLISSLVIIITLYGFANYGCYRYYNQLKKLAYFVILLFFITYISLFYISRADSLYLEQDNKDFSQIDKIFNNNSNLKGRPSSISISYKNFDTKSITFVDVNNTNPKEPFNSYIRYEFESQKPVKIYPDEDLYLKKNKSSNGFKYVGYYDYKRNKFNISNMDFVNPKTPGNILNSFFKKPENNYLSKRYNYNFFRTIEFVFVTIFYVFGTIIYSREFFMRNIKP